MNIKETRNAEIAPTCAARYGRIALSYPAEARQQRGQSGENAAKSQRDCAAGKSREIARFCAARGPRATNRGCLMLLLEVSLSVDDSSP